MFKNLETYLKECTLYGSKRVEMLQDSIGITSSIAWIDLEYALSFSSHWPIPALYESSSQNLKRGSCLENIHHPTVSCVEFVKVTQEG